MSRLSNTPKWLRPNSKEGNAAFAIVQLIADIHRKAGYPSMQCPTGTAIATLIAEHLGTAKPEDIAVFRAEQAKADADFAEFMSKPDNELAEL
jgi:hypothetical protein